MAKKNKATETKSVKAIPAVSANHPPFLARLSNMLPAGICLLYFAVHFLPDFGAYDAMGSQWLYLVCLDIAVTLLILIRNTEYREAAAAIVKNIFSKIYLAFFVLAGISTFIAINPTESWVCYVRLIATVVAFFNIGILLYNRTDLFKLISQLLSLILLVESFQSMSLFLNGVATTPMTELIMSLKGNAGNKNIYSAGMVAKIPFVLYCIHTSKIWGRIFNIGIFLFSAIAIFIINTRAAYVSLFLITVIYILFCLLSFRKERNTEQTLFRIGYILFPLIIAFLIAQVELSNVLKLQDTKDVQYYGSVTSRLSTVTQASDASNQVRFRLWKHALDYTSQHPLMGCGYGNWKIASIPYQRTITNDLWVPVHSHNDILEMFAELGIAGGMLYFSLFVCILVFSIKTYFSKASEETKLVSYFSLMAFATYSVDAFFNFPMERPLNQVFFALITAVNITAYLTGKAEEKETAENAAPVNGLYKTGYGLLALLMLIPAFYVTFLTYKSLIVQRSLLQDLNNEPLKLNYKEIFPTIPSIPNLSATGQPIDAIKGRYLSEAKKYDEALALLDKGREANPVIGYTEFLKAGLYFNTGKLDSAFRNGMVAFNARPRAKTYYQTLMAVLARQRDSVNIKKIFEEYKLHRPDVFAWSLYLQAMLNAKGAGDPQLLALADSSLRMFKNDPDVGLLVTRRAEIANNMGIRLAANIDYALSQKYYNEAVAAFGTGNAEKENLGKAASLFVKSATINPGNYVALENAAISYFNMKDWNKAILYFNKELALNVSANGKPEFFKGAALINLGKKQEGCALLQTASAKGYKEADAIIKSNCN